MRTHWAVAQVMSKRTHLIQAELEKGGIGTFQPTFVRRWYTDGKLSTRERPLLPGYVMVRIDEGWGTVRDVEGVIRVLANNGRASPVRDDEMARLVLGHATRAWDDIEQAPVSAVRRPRKPRPSKRVRRRLRAARAIVGGN